MRTAQCIVPLAIGTHARSAAVIEAVDLELTNLAAGSERLSGIRFAGYATAAELARLNLTELDGIRCALYEADYPDTAA